MGNFVTVTSFLSVSGTAATAATNFPVSNALTAITKPYTVFKTTGAAGTAQDIVVDFGAAQSLETIIVDRSNAGSVIIQGNATNSWASPSYWGTVTLGTDTLDGRTKSFIDLRNSSFDSTGYRYCRIRPAGTATQYGGTVWEVGSILFSGTVTEWESNFAFPYGRVFLQNYDPGTKASGGAEPAAFGNPYCRLTLNTQAIGTAMLTTLDALMRVGPHAPVAFWRNNGGSAEVYLAHRIGEVRVDHGGPGFLEPSALIFEEYV
jgi:hypothetical protein